MPPPEMLETVYATDEDVAIRASGDFAILCPAWQTLAYAADGSISTASPWSLSSASVDFVASGVIQGCVVRLTKPTTAFKGSGDLLAVDSAVGGTATLRRVGMPLGTGKPPAPGVSLAGVEFTVATLYPQIEDASFTLNRKWGIDPSSTSRRPVDLRDVRDLREATVLTVLLRMYVAENRSDRGDFAIKIKAVQQAFDAVNARLELRWGFVDDPLNPPTSIFGKRIYRG